MSGELGALIREAEAGWEQVEAGKELDQVGRARLVGRARRTRAMRTGRVAAAAVVLVAAAGGGVLLLTWPEPAPPVDTQTTAPSPSSSASPSPTPTPTPTPAPTPTETAPPNPGFAGTVTVDPHLPSAQAITPEVWAQAGSGWVLASYQELGSLPGSVRGPQVVYLVSPEGLRYQLTAIEGDQTVQVVAWRPGLTTALSLAHPTDAEQAESWSGASTWVMLDLATGVISPVDVGAPSPSVSLEGLDAPLPDGRRPIGGGLAVDASGAVTALPAAGSAVAAAVAAQRPGYATCGDPVRLDGRSWVAVCEREAPADWDTGLDASPTQPLILRVGDDGAVSTLAAPTPPDQPLPWTLAVVDGVVLAQASTEWSVVGCPTGRYRLDDGVLTPLPGVVASSFPEPSIFQAAGASGTSAYTQVTGGCSGDVQPQTLVRDDLATGAHAELVPYPADGESVMRSLTGWYVVP